MEARAECASARGDVLAAHTHTHTGRIQACVAWDEPVMQEGFLIWLYPNECNSVFSNWRQRDAPVIQPMPVDPTRSTSQTSTPGAPKSARWGWTQDTNSLVSHIRRSSNPAWRLDDNTHVQFSKTNTQSGSVFCWCRGETPLLGLFSTLLSLSPFASIFVSNFLW